MSRRISTSVVVALALSASVFAVSTPMGAAPATGEHVRSIQMIGMTTGVPNYPTMPATFVYNDQVNNLPMLTNVETGSDPRTACNDAAAAWTQVASPLTFADGGVSSVTDTGNDGINLITFANTPANVSAVGSALAVTVFFYNGSFEFTDVDIVFNPAQNFSTLGSASFHDIQAVATHEFGHAFGLSHTGVCAATMFPFISEGVTDARSLSLDDVAGIHHNYPTADEYWSTGAISGTITLQGSGSMVYGAHVVARDFTTGVTVTSTLSQPDGSYTLTNLPVGAYLVYAEPLDGPVGDSNIQTSFWTSGKNTSFRTEFFGGNATPTPVRVRPAVITGMIDISVDGTAPTLNMTLSNEASSPLGFTSVDSAGFELAAGASTHIVIGGLQVSTTADSAFTIAGDQFLTMGPVSTNSGNFTGNPPETWKIFPLQIASDAPAGPRDVVMTVGGETTVYCGVVDVVNATPPAGTSLYGDACGGLLIGANGTPSLGNPTFGLTLAGAVPGETAFFFVSVHADAIDLGSGSGCFQYIDLDTYALGSSVSEPITGAGTSSHTFGVPNIPGLAGTVFHAQIAATNSGASLGYETTEGMRILVR